MFNLTKDDFSNNRLTMPTSPQFVESLHRCKTFDSIAVETGSIFCQLRSEGLTIPDAIAQMRLIQSTLQKEKPTSLLRFAAMRIEHLIDSFIPQETSPSPAESGEFELSLQHFDGLEDEVFDQPSRW